jgi:4-hydroxybenzoate polyprenyltransferase
MKRTPVGPLFMGACRFFNLLLGMSTAGAIACGGPAWLLYYEAGQLLVAGAIGIYIAGVTWFARTEAVESNRGHLAGGMITMIAGLALLAAYPWLPNLPLGHFATLNPMMWQLLIVLLGFTIARSAAMAVYDPDPLRVQMAVKTAILSLIVLDAAIAMIIGPSFALGVLVLLLPTLLLGRWVYST